MGTLFDRARSGDPAAEAEIHSLIRTFARLVCRGGGPLGAPDMSWEDVAQAASLKVLTTGLKQYRGSGSETSYLYAVVRTTVIQMARSAERRRRRERSEAGPESTRPEAEARIDVRGILASLTRECRDLLERIFMGGASYAELAQELGLEESSVRSRVSRCMKTARRISQDGRKP